MKVVGITGRSGCGKSSATKFLAGQGYPCIDADLIAREMLLPGSPCIAQLQEKFGADIADENGNVRRRALTAITQPEILHRIETRLQEAEQGGAELAFVDGAVIVGTPFEARCDALVLISAPYDTSVARICARDGIAPEMARRRLDAQTPIETLRAAATHEVVNDGTAEQLAEKMHAVLQQL